MSTIMATAQLRAQQALTALQQNKPDLTRKLVLELVAEGLADASTYICLAYAQRSLGDAQGAASAIDGALELDPGNLVALICKADLLDAAGNARKASLFYRSAIDQASRNRNLPKELAHEVARAKTQCERYQQLFQSQLQTELGRLASASIQQAPRFAASMDLLSGKKQIFYQQPKIYYFPGLPQTQFFAREGFPWLTALEASWEDIRDECVEVMRDPTALRPYVEHAGDRPQGASKDSLVNNSNWSAFHLWKDGKIVAENARRCPKTLAALEDVPFTQMAGRSPSVMFSVLRPGTRIPPHHGMVNTRLICHLPLIVPPQCGLRVGNETRGVVEGKAWVFDDTMEHEAWNLSDQMRVVLLFEVWRPELSHVERSLVRSMFSAIDQYQGPSSTWKDQ